MKKNKVIVVLLTVLIIAGIAIFAFREAKKTVDKGEATYDVVFFGDSIIAGDRAAWNVPIKLSEIGGYKVLNAAVGGMSLSVIDAEYLVGSSDNLFTMVGLSEGVKAKDFTNHMISQKNTGYTTEYRYGVSVDLSNVDWDSVRYILIEHGANDYLNGAKLDNSDDKYDPQSYGGALRTSIENVQAGVPNAQLILVTPIYMNPAGLHGDCYEVDYGGGYLEDYVNKEKEIAAEYGLYVIDNFTEVPINKENYEIYIPGGLHGSLEGNILIAENISRHLKELDGIN